MGFMNVFVFLIITAEVHIHNKIPNNRIPKAPQARNCYEKTKKERLRFLFLVTFSFSVPGFFFFFLFLVSFSVLLVYGSGFGLDTCFSTSTPHP